MIRFGIVNLILLAASLAIIVSGPSYAQDRDWSYSASIYLFTPETNTSTETAFGTVDATLSFSDALDNLDFAFMGAFGASNGRWSLLADYMLTDISFGTATPGGAFGELNTSVKTQFFNAYAAYRVYEDSNVSLDAGAGFRWYSTDTVFTLTQGALPDRTNTVDEDWFDPLIAMRARVQFSDRWSGTAFLDYGGFRSGSETWQVLLTADYALNDRWLLRGGYRHIEVDHEINGADYTFDQSGPIFGATILF